MCQLHLFGGHGSLGGFGNIGADPRFRDPLGPDGLAGTADDNLRLDAGSTGLLPADEYDLDDDGNTTELLPVDLDGHARLVDDPDTPDIGIPDLPTYPQVGDMGPYEYVPADLDGNGSCRATALEPDITPACARRRPPCLYAIQ